MQKICTTAVAQVMQRHSGGWKASPAFEQPAHEAVPPTQVEAAAPERAVREPTKSVGAAS
jgi:hypothetical protein